MPNQKPESFPFNPYKHQHHFVRHIITTLILVIITFVGGLYFAGVGIFSPFTGDVFVIQEGVSVKKVAPKKGSYEEGYQAALDFAKKRMAEEGVIEGYGEEGEAVPLNFLRATVKSISGQNVTIEFKASELDIFLEGMATKTVVVSGTIIEHRTDKPEEQIAKEYEIFEKAYQELEARFAENPEAEVEFEELQEPLTYTVVNLSAGDLMAGDVLTIRTDSDIRTTDSFEASFVRLVSRLVEDLTPEQSNEDIGSAFIAE